jgi:RNA-directed DNA polymerase
MSQAKPHIIDRKLYDAAFAQVRKNRGAAGIDGESIERFEKNLDGSLYKLWNRMSSGTYFPPAVRQVEIPKGAGGGVRKLGIPTVADRLAQTVVKMVLEPILEPYFMEDSYGYRPNKSAHDAVEVTRERCWKYPWVVEFDIVKFFDNLSHKLIEESVCHHTDSKWIHTNIKRWIRAPFEKEDGSVEERSKGVPQGGVISPLLANLSLHYIFDKWMGREFPGLPWCRYADDGLIHCGSEATAVKVLDALSKRFVDCGLELHPEKTRIVYCGDGKRKGTYPNQEFTFLGFTFKARWSKSKRVINGSAFFSNFSPAVSKEALLRLRVQIRTWNLGNRTRMSIEDIGRSYNSVIRGWITYYGRFRPSALNPFLRYLNLMLRRWAMRKYKRLAGHLSRASDFIYRLAHEKKHLLAHWQRGMYGVFV